jgi:hypothetical protein
MTTGESLLPETYDQELKDRSQMKIGPRFFTKPGARKAWRLFFID